MEKDLEPRLTEAKAGKRTVYFADAAHFVCGAFLGYIWSIVRVFSRSLKRNLKRRGDKNFSEKTVEK